MRIYDGKRRYDFTGDTRMLKTFLEYTIGQIPPSARTPLWRVCITVGLVLSVAWSLGFAGDDSGFAREKDRARDKIELQAQIDGIKTDVADVKRELSAKIDAAEKDRIEQLIFEARIEQCMATGELRTLHANRVSALLAKWRTLVGDQSATPTTYVDCDDLG